VTKDYRRLKTPADFAQRLKTDPALRRLARPDPLRPPEPVAERKRPNRPRKQLAVLEIVRAEYPDGNLPRTADVWRKVKEKWAPVAKRHGFDPKKPPTFHTVNRALDREL